ncbi:MULTISPECIES: DUF2561 family protein [Mycobacteriaceae]|uniref:DUF2561 family protein n=1 Tax=Mycobacteriaceae TaxID=1762 RepID=UPI0007FE76E1|nr:MULTISPECIES: DUF2561 family protein [Mycobacteriaceae]MCK0173396.1 DUF2561 family protein [Mycolicibacterium sp. F2034L]OBB59383.1 hypothetical protein A5757_13705 [Mycobacterium sp. 852013-51886_SCH5428379]
MAQLTDAGAPSAHLDRILMSVCAAAWLAALGAAVAATVALTDLGGRHPQPSGGGETPWLLYTVIGVSAAVIVAAVPLLLRARRTAQADPAPAPLVQDRPTPSAAPEPRTERMRAITPTQVPTSLPPGSPTAAVDQLWLRSVLAVTTAMGLAVTAIGTATYLMAVDSDTAAWALYGVAAVATLAMPVAAWWHLRRLRELLEPTV